MGVRTITEVKWTGFADDWDTENERNIGADNEISRPSYWIELGNVNQSLREIDTSGGYLGIIRKQEILRKKI